MTQVIDASVDDVGVRVQRADGVVTVLLDRPSRKNALGPPQWRALLAALRGIDPRVDRVLVLTGGGTDFCAGADVSVVPDPSTHTHERMRVVGDVAVALNELAIPSVAVVRGVAVGAGLSLALGCDFVVCSDDARFSQIFARLALSPDCGASWLVPRLIGLARAKQLALLGDMVSAAEALALGLVYRVAPSAELDAVAGELVERLRTGPTTALGLTRALLNDAFDVTLAQAVQNEGKALAVNLTSTDTAEAVTAFREKRKAHFTGR